MAEVEKDGQCITAHPGYTACCKLAMVIIINNINNVVVIVILLQLVIVMMLFYTLDSPSGDNCHRLLAGKHVQLLLASIFR